jgi:23S rRNA (adenine(2503)-C(2))-methyltransferase
LWRSFLSNVDCDFKQIPEFPRRLASVIDDKFVRISSSVVASQESRDGTIKLLIRLQDGHEVETVIIDHTKRAGGEIDNKGRVTLCVSSQVGCAMKCGFCATGTLGLSGNLLAGEILEQFWHASRIRKGITNVVFMGMGEPLENYANVIAAVKGLTDVYRFGIGDNSVTVSTVGVIDKIYRLMEDCPSVHLALSLHAPNQRIRETIVPTARSWPMDKLMAAVDYYNNNQKYKGRKKGRIMMEYVVIKDMNDSEECAHELGQLLQNRKCMVNLIPFNPFEGNDFKEPSDAAVDRMLSIVSSYGVVTIKRKHHGRDIAGACGQLAKVVKDIEDLGPCSDADNTSSMLSRGTSVPEIKGKSVCWFGIVAGAIALVGLGFAIARRQ